MYSVEFSQHWLSASRSALKVSHRSIFLLYSILCLVSLLEPVESNKRRCGTELIADLEFVCGDRGFYIGRTARYRARRRLQEQGIVDQCCLKSCGLSYMETFCAKPKKSRRVTPTPPQQVMEQQFQTVFHRRLVKHLETANGAERRRGKNQRRDKDSSLLSTEHLTSSPPTVLTSPLSMIPHL